jgi:lipoyl(octanoyl) transferase
VKPDLSYFKRIIPCGLAWAEVTSMRQELDMEQSMQRIRNRFLHHFAEVFGYSQVEKTENEESRMEDHDPRPA